MTHATTIPSESAAPGCRCLDSQFLRSTAAADLGLGLVANIGLALALLLAGVLIWSGSSHGAWRYGAADLGFILVAAAFGLGALRMAARARTCPSVIVSVGGQPKQSPLERSSRPLPAD